MAEDRNCMYRREFSRELARRTGMAQEDADVAVAAFLNIIADSWVEMRPICFDGFGIFSIRPTSERMARNPKSMEDVLIPAGYKPVFKVSKGMKAAVNQQIQMRTSQNDPAGKASEGISSEMPDEMSAQGTGGSPEGQSRHDSEF